jgi:hypothetical protein
MKLRRREKAASRLAARKARAKKGDGYRTPGSQNPRKGS